MSVDSFTEPATLATTGQSHAAADLATRLCRLVALDDLAGKGVYILPASMMAPIDARYRGSEQCGGWIMTGLDLLARPWLQKIGAWRGRGMAFIVRDDRLRTLAQFCAVAIHETAHYLSMDAAIDSMSEADAATVLATNPLDLPAENKLSGPERFKASGLPQWHHHEARFIRAALHLQHRAQQLHVALDGVCVAGWTYGLAPWPFYAQALGDELEARADEPIRSILATPAPDHFQQLWECDTAGDIRTDRGRELVAEIGNASMRRLYGPPPPVPGGEV